MKAAVSSVLIILLGITKVYAATTYFVSPVGSNNNNGTSAPFLTLQKCLDTVRAGDTCVLENGEYAGHNNTKINGPVTIKSRNRYGAKIMTSTLFDAVNYGLYIYHDNYLIDGLDFTGAGGSGNTNLSNTGIGIGGGTGTIIRNNKIHGMSRTICTSSEDGSQGIYVEGPSNVTIENNIIYNIGRLLQREGCNVDSHNHDHGIYIKTVAGITVQGNVIYDSYRGWPIHVFGGIVSNLKIYNNTLADRDTEFNAGQILLSYTINSGSVKNNICYNPIAWCVSYSSSPLFSNVVVENNLSTGDIDGGGRPPGISFNNNLINQSGSAFFSSPSTRDYTLKVGSPAIDRGVNISEIFVDINGVSRPQNTIIDIGAYEYLSGSSAPAIPSPPQNLRAQ
jgi:hypothetical protein